MHETSRIRPVVTVLFAVGALACRDVAPPIVGGPTPFDGMTPLVEGTIRSRAPVDGAPGMLVYEDGATENDCFPHRALFAFGPDVMVFNNGVPKYIPDLKTGQRVSVFGVMLSNAKICIPPARAHGILIE